MLESGDLIFVREASDMGKAIQESTGNYRPVRPKRWPHGYSYQ